MFKINDRVVIANNIKKEFLMSEGLIDNLHTRGDLVSFRNRGTDTVGFIGRIVKKLEFPRTASTSITESAGNWYEVKTKMSVAVSEWLIFHENELHLMAREDFTPDCGQMMGEPNDLILWLEKH